MTRHDLRRAPLDVRFWARVDRRGPNECWPWLGAHQSDGYGHIRLGHGQGMIRAHRLAWFYAWGSLPKHLQIMHSCDNPDCVNPKHLFKGSQHDNMVDCARKGRNCTIGWSRKTHCIKGHPFNETNTRWGVGSRGRPRRYCRVCARVTSAAGYARRKQRTARARRKARLLYA